MVGPGRGTLSPGQGMLQLSSASPSFCPPPHTPMGLVVKELQAENQGVNPRCTSPSHPQKTKTFLRKMVQEHLLGQACGSRPGRIPANGGFGKKSSILGKTPTFPSAQQIVPVSTEPTKAKMFITKENYKRGVPESGTKCKTGNKCKKLYKSFNGYFQIWSGILL